jgi:ankyrin repeat protein
MSWPAAIRARDHDALRRVLAAGITPQRDPVTGQTPLLLAATQNDPVAVSLLLDAGAADACEREGAVWSSLAEALRLGHREAAQGFLAHPRGFGWDAQWWSLDGLLQGPHDDVGLLQALLAHGAQLPYRPKGPLPEHIVAESGHVKIAQELFERGLLRSAVLDDAGWVPLLRAARAGDYNMARVFLDYGAPLNSRIEWRDRRSALHIAVQATKNREAIVTWLLARGIDTRILDEAGLTAAERALEIGEGGLARIIHERAGRGGPRWHREAVRAGMNDVVCSNYDEADGFCFDPHDVVQPFLIGGDYDGAFPETPRAALDFVRGCDPHSELGRVVTPWLPILDRMLAGKDVGLDELLRLGRRRSHP